MNLGKHIFGIHESIFTEVDESVKNRQYWAYNLLALMFYILVAGCVISGVVYGLVLFNNWIIAIGMGVLLGFISFVLLILVLFLNMTTNHRDLYMNMTNMSSIFEPYLGQDFSNLSDADAVKMVKEQKVLLRETNHTPSFDHFHMSGVITSLIKVCLVLILSCVVANAVEILMFHSKINQTLHLIKDNPTLKEAAYNNDSTAMYPENNQILAKWTLDMVTEDPNSPFLFIDSKSILLTHKVLNLSIGNFKYLMDVLIALLFLLPLILVRKSKEYGGGEFLKESALLDISISYYAFLITQRSCQKIKQKIENDYDYNSLVKSLEK